MTRSLVPLRSLAALAVLLLDPAPASSYTYLITEIAHSDDGFADFGAAAMNRSNSNVIFRARRDGVSGIYFGSGGVPGTIVTTADGFADFGYEPRMDQALAVFTDDGSISNRRLWEKVDAVSPPSLLGEFWAARDPDLNGSHTLAFGYYDSWTNLFRIDASGPLVGTVPVAHSIVGSYSDPSISDADEVAVSISTSLLSGVHRFALSGSGVLIASGSSIDLGQPFTTVSGLASVNDSGRVAFRATRRSDGARAIYTGRGGALALIADSTGPYADFTSVAISDPGVVVFRATLDGDTVGIFAGPDPVLHDVIQVGDPLGGSFVTNVDFREGGLNDAGQVAFFARLQDGTEGIYRADPIALGLVAATVPVVTMGSASEALVLDAAGSSSDPQDPIVQYAWDLDADGTPDWLAQQPKTQIPASFHGQFLGPGANEIQLRVTTQLGYYALADAVVTQPTGCSNGTDDDQDQLIDTADPGCRDAFDPTEQFDCADGVDNDGDGQIDALADSGCKDVAGDREDPQCANGVDDDADGLVDADDPGCDFPWKPDESPACNDGVDNDQDGSIDLADPGCQNKPWRTKEVKSGCGLGAEILVVAAALRALGRRSARTP